ncbi:hypothetical protein, partial [Dasania marina]|uniref:hypothetical protein n=1 Tax=Dasania marina TaxID=471499 RepID=UPI0030DD91BB
TPKGMLVIFIPDSCGRKPESTKKRKPLNRAQLLLNDKIILSAAKAKTPDQLLHDKNTSNTINAGSGPA